MNNIAPHPSFVVAVIVSGDQILAVSRRNEPSNLSLPGGSIEPEELPFDALVREAKEETNVDVRAAAFAFARANDASNGKVVWAYVVTEWEGDPQQMEDGISVQWVEPARLLEEGCAFRDYNARLFVQLGIA